VVLLRIVNLSGGGARGASLRSTDCTHNQMLLPKTSTALRNEGTDSSVKWPNAGKTEMVIIRCVGYSNKVHPKRVGVVSNHRMDVPVGAVDIDAHC